MTDTEWAEKTQYFYGQVDHESTPRAVFPLGFTKRHTTCVSHRRGSQT